MDFTVPDDGGDTWRAHIRPEELDAQERSRSETRVAEKPEPGFGNVTERPGDVVWQFQVEPDDEERAFPLLAVIMSSIPIE